MKARHVLPCIGFLTLVACDAGGDKARLNSFKKHIENTQTAYSKSGAFVAYALNKAGEIRNQQGENQMSAFLTGLDFRDCLENARSASDSMAAAEGDFRFIYAQDKESRPAFREDFYRLKTVVANHFVFAKSVSEGDVVGSGVERWLQDDRESKGVFKRLIAETKRLGNP